MVRRICECGMLSCGASVADDGGLGITEGRGAGAGTGAALAAASIWALTSSRMMRPLGPLPVSLTRSMPFSRARRRASGLANRRLDAAAARDSGRGADGLAWTPAPGVEASASPVSACGASDAAIAASSSPASARTPMAVSTGSTFPAACRIRASRPPLSLEISTTALSVSTSAKASPASSMSPSALSQRDRVPSVILARMAGNRRTSAMDEPRQALQAGDHLLGAGIGRALEDFRDGGGSFAARHPLDRMIEPVEQPMLDGLGKPPAIGRALRPLLDDDHQIGLLDAFGNRIPVEAGAVETAQIDDLDIRAKRLDGFERACDHGGIGQQRRLRTLPANGGLAERNGIVEIVDGRLAGRLV